MERTAIPRRFLQDLAGPAWVAIQAEVLPGVVDSQIAYVTPEMDRLYGYVWPDTLVGRYISALHLFEEAQITRQYAERRHGGMDAPRHYVMHGVHPNGRIVRVIKHVTQYAVEGKMLWVTHHAAWHRSSSYPFLQPMTGPLLPPEAPRVLSETISVAHVQRVAPLLAQPRGQGADVPLPPVDTPPFPQETPATAERPSVRGALPALPKLGPWLRSARVAQQWSLHTVAQRCTRLLGHRVTPQYLSNLEHDYRQPSLRLLRVLATVLALDPTTLGTVLFEGPARPHLPRASTPPTAEELLGRVRQAAHHLQETQQHYRALLQSAHQAGASLRQLAAVTGRSPSRMQQLVHPSRSSPQVRRVERQEGC